MSITNYVIWQSLKSLFPQGEQQWQWIWKMLARLFKAYMVSLHQENLFIYSLDFTTQSLYLSIFLVLYILRRSKKLLLKQLLCASVDSTVHHVNKFSFFQEVLISNREISYTYANLSEILVTIFLHILQFLCNSTSTSHMHILLPPFISIPLQICTYYPLTFELIIQLSDLSRFLSWDTYWILTTCDGGVHSPKSIARPQRGLLLSKLCSAEHSSGLQTVWSRDNQVICKCHSGASLWKMPVVWVLLGSHPLCYPWSFLYPWPSESAFQVISYKRLSWMKLLQCSVALWMPFGMITWRSLRHLHVSFRLGKTTSWVEFIHTLYNDFKILYTTPLHTGKISTIRF